VVDSRAASEAAVAHLIAQGHRRIAHLGDLTSIYTARERYEGYRDAHLRAGLTLDPALCVADLHNSELAEAAALALLSLPDPPTAIFGSQNLVTVGVVKALRATGQSHAIAVVGFDDFALADLVDPPITVVAQNAAALGTAAAELLLARLGGDASPPRSIVIPTELIQRGSGEIQGPAQG
jgi:LacI family transcriptional regulator